MQQAWGYEPDASTYPIKVLLIDILNHTFHCKIVSIVSRYNLWWEETKFCRLYSTSSFSEVRCAQHFQIIIFFSVTFVYLLLLSFSFDSMLFINSLSRMATVIMMERSEGMFHRSLAAGKKDVRQKISRNLTKFFLVTWPYYISFMLEHNCNLKNWEQIWTPKKSLIFLNK